MMDHTSQTMDDWVKGRIVLPSHLKNTENKVIVFIIVVFNNNIIIITIVATEVVQFGRLAFTSSLTTVRVAGL